MRSDGRNKTVSEKAESRRKIDLHDNILLRDADQRIADQCLVEGWPTRTKPLARQTLRVLVGRGFLIDRLL